MCSAIRSQPYVTRLFRGLPPGVLVLAKTEKNRLSQTIIPRPLGKFHLANQFGFHPVAVFHF